ncbi:MAG: 4Fe-4S dicluster domain-containing protein, partial [Planctomycetaceae bacterium]
GRAKKLTTTMLATGGGFVCVPAIELTDIKASGEPPATAEFDWLAAKPQALRARIAEGGLTTCNRRPTALAKMLERALSRQVKILIGNGMESQPFVTAEHRIMVERGPDIVRGLAIIAAAMETGRTILAVDHRRTDAYRELVKPAGVYRLERVALSHKYPTGDDAMLASILAGREIPIGGGTFDVGAAVVNIATCLAVHDWIILGRPPVERVVTLSGERMAKPGNFRIPFGTPISDLAAATRHSRLIHGGPMTGLACVDHAVVGPSTDAVLAIEQLPRTAPGACIRCGWCTDHCPVQLNVAALNDMYELNHVRRAEKAGSQACIACGVCSYICPASLPLMHRVQHLNAVIRKSGTSS